VLAELDGLGAKVELHPTSARGDAEKMTRLANPNEIDALIIAGGDGTIAEAVNGADGRLPIGIIPLGTANVLAHELALPVNNPAELARIILDGRERIIHTGLVNGRRFVLMAGIGLDAKVVANISLSLKKYLGKLAYVIETLRQTWAYEFPQLTLRLSDGKIHHGLTIIACKGRLYGGNFIAAPQADLGKASLEVLILRHGGFWGTALASAALLAGKISSLGEIVTCEGFVLEGPTGAPIQADGDIVGHLPAVVSVDPLPLRLIVP
jgi:YegS/Rv2252/BmrU family lipid kinase